MNQEFIFIGLILLAVFLGGKKSRTEGFASYEQHQFGHDCTPRTYKPHDYGYTNSMFYHYLPYHYGYGERAFGMYRPNASTWF